MSRVSRRAALAMLVLAACAPSLSSIKEHVSMISVLDAPFCADPTGATSSHVAFGAALAHLRDNRGGVLFVPRGRYMFTHPIASVNLLNRGAGIMIVGEGSATEICPRQIGNAPLFRFDNAADRIVLSHFAVLGDGVGAHADCGAVVYASYCHGGLEVSNVLFGGLRSDSGDYLGLVDAYLSDVSIRASGFLGCAHTHVNGAAVHAYEFRNVLVEDTRFIDYLAINGENHTKTGFGNSCWVRVEQPNKGVQESALEHGSIALRMCRFDEGGFPQVRIDAGTGQRIDRAVIEDCNVNVSPASNGLGVLVSGVDHVTVRRTRFGWGNGNSIAIRVSDCDVVEFEHVKAVAGSPRIIADAATKYLHLRDCIGTVESNAACTKRTCRGVTT